VTLLIKRASLQFLGHPVSNHSSIDRADSHPARAARADGPLRGREGHYGAGGGNEPPERAGSATA